MALASVLPLPGPPKTTAGRIPGNKGIWVGIFCELTEFALMFIVFFIARAHNPEAFHAGPARLATSAGVANTVLMLSSSYFVARAVSAMRRNRPRATFYWLLGALACGAGYLIVKSIEFAWYGEQGINGATGIFFTTYYYLAFNHLVHVAWGSLGILWVMARTWAGAYSPADYEGLEAFAMYWHTIDLAWLIIFPIAYVWH